MGMEAILMAMYERMAASFGPQHWWPAEGPLEMMVGAVLTQNTSWRNVEKAIEGLKARSLIDAEALGRIPFEELAQTIRPAGYYNIKARRLKNLAEFIRQRSTGHLDLLFSEETGALREALLGVKGIGPETADSILLYAAGRPVFVVDAYTHRILGRHELISEEATYDEMQACFMDHLPQDAALYNEFHALIVRTAKTCCGKRPNCAACPLEGWPADI